MREQRGFSLHDWGGRRLRGVEGVCGSGVVLDGAGSTHVEFVIVEVAWRAYDFTADSFK